MGRELNTQTKENKKPYVAKFVLQFWARLADCNDLWALRLTALALLVIECFVTSAIILKISYTKIDWDAYMSQVSGFVAGERNYSNLSGDTGPLVYPAGFLYVFSFLQIITSGYVPYAQWWFGFLYIFNQALVLLIYVRSQIVPPWALVLLCLSKRIHSIFVLRLFNDCVTMTIFYCAALFLQKRKWIWGLIVFSLALSIKMNVLLFLPPLLILLAQGQSTVQAIVSLSVALVIQVAIGMPFLLTFPSEYLSGAFNFGRVFIHFWSVNFKFVPEHVFVSKPFATSLLAVHLLLLLLFAHFKWCRQQGGLLSLLLSHVPFLNKSAEKEDKPWLNSRYVALVLFEGNFIGIVCARSLHYQFYSWYFHSIPALLWVCPFPNSLRLGLWIAVEACWNIYPSSFWSSVLLLACHGVILLGLSLSKTVSPPYLSVPRKEKET